MRLSAQDTIQRSLCILIQRMNEAARSMITYNANKPFYNLTERASVRARVGKVK